MAVTMMPSGNYFLYRKLHHDPVATIEPKVVRFESLAGPFDKEEGEVVVIPTELTGGSEVEV